MAEKPLLCPVKQSDCVREKCQWWMEGDRECAVEGTAGELGRAVTLIHDLLEEVHGIHHLLQTPEEASQKRS